MEVDLSDIPELDEHEYLNPIDASIEEAVINNKTHNDQVSEVVIVDPAEIVVQNSGKNIFLVEGIDGVVQQVELSENRSIQAVIKDKVEDVLLREVDEDSYEKLHSVMANSVHHLDNNKECLFEDGKFPFPSKSIQHKKLNKDFWPIKGSLTGKKMIMLGESDGFTFPSIT
ncbi:hypothetical protein MA16_Dca027778 [Dendrobium catenatum]|uniref:Uncharacterized protein n=1 Tax=Dendrobium catenatum TaxID=906689 RepID=A0A2I0VZI6_9ASPA|nr:hypothetical protein MA16_Dca027778 [Dendrobium catenatum]